MNRYIGRDDQFFIDDHLIDTMTGLERVVQTPEKCDGNPVLRGDGPGRRPRACGRPSDRISLSNLAGTVWLAVSLHDLDCRCRFELGAVLSGDVESIQIGAVCQQCGRYPGNLIVPGMSVPFYLVDESA